MTNVLFLGYGPIAEGFLKQIPDTCDYKIHVVSNSKSKNPNRIFTSFSNYREIPKFNGGRSSVIFFSWRKIDEEKIAYLNGLDPKILQSSLAINFSSCAVYGPGLMKRADLSSCRPINQYGIDKLEVEQILRDASFKKLITLRIANLYGLKGFKDITNNVIDSIFLGTPLKVSNYGNNFRDFVFVEDLFNGLQFLLNKYVHLDYSGKEEVFDFASGIPTKINDLIDLIETCALSKVQNRENMQMVESEIDAITQDPAHMIHFFGFDPTEIKAGMKQYIRARGA